MLDPSDTKEKRDERKNEAIRTREAGKLEEAVEIFSEVLAWDQENENPKGEMDTLGHLRIIYSKLADQQENEDEQRHYFEMAMDTAESILEIGRTALGLEKKELSIPLIHSADARMDFSRYLDGDARHEMLRLALEDMSYAMEYMASSELENIFGKEYAESLKQKAQNILNTV